MPFDMTESIAPNSPQVNAEDLLAGDRTVLIREVRKGPSAEQPVAVVLDEFGPERPYLPCKSMRRVFVSAWGADGEAYVGKRLTIYNDPTVKWGGMAVGGIRIRAMSHLPKRLTLALTATRGKKVAYVVEPLPDAAPTPDGITPEQSQKLTALLQGMGLDRDAARTLVGDIAGRPVASARDLTRPEAAAVIAELDAGAAHEPPTDEPEPPGDAAALWPENACDQAMTAAGTPACTWARVEHGHVACGCGWTFTATSNKRARKAHHKHVVTVRLSLPWLAVTG